MKFFSVPAAILVIAGTANLFAGTEENSVPAEDSVCKEAKIESSPSENLPNDKISNSEVENFASLKSVPADPISVYAEALRSRSSSWQNVTPEQRSRAIEMLVAAYKRSRDDDSPTFSPRYDFFTNFKHAADDYDEIIEEFAATPFAAEALYQKSVIYTLAHMFDDAFECVEQLIRIWPGSDRVGDALIQGYFICDALRQGARPRRFGGRLPWLLDREAVLKLYERLYNLGPKAIIAPRVLFQKACLAEEISDDFFKGDLKQEAINTFEQLIAVHPESSLIPEAYLHLAGTYQSLCMGEHWDQLAARRAMNYYSDFYALFPEHEQAEFAFEQSEMLRETLAANRVALGDFYYIRRNNIRAAKNFYNEAISVAPSSNSAERARERLADIAAGKRADMTLIDWLFGRYPAPVTKDFVDHQTQQSLDQMGFQTAESLERSREVGDESSSKSATNDAAGTSTRDDSF